MPPVKNLHVTSYGGIIRIRLKGRSSVTSSQPAPQAPLYVFWSLLYLAFPGNAIGIPKKQIRRTLRIREGDPLHTALTSFDLFLRSIVDFLQRITGE